MKIRSFFSLLFFLITVNAINADNLDSLKTIAQNTRMSDIEQVDINYIIADTYFHNHLYDSALVYSSKCVEIFNRTQLKEKAVEILWLQSKILKEQGFNKRLFPNHLQLIQILKKKNDSIGLMDAYDKMGFYYYHYGVVDSAFFYYNKAYEIGIIKNNNKALMDSYNNFSMVFNYQQNYHKELDYLMKGLALAQESDDNISMGTFYHNIALAYLYLEKYDSAKICADKAIEINTKANIIERIALNNTALGNIYALQGDITKALEYFNKALAFNIKSGNLANQVESNYNIGFSYMMLGDYSQSNKYYFESLRIAKSIQLTSYQVDLFLGISEVFELMGDVKKSFAYYKLYDHLNDSIKEATNVGLISKVQAEYKYERNAIEIELLSKENELKDKRVKNTIALASVSIISLIILVVLVILVLRKLKRNQDLNEELKRKNIDISDKNERLQCFESEIIDDFNFARNLQQYFFSDTKDFKNIFTNSVFKTFTKKPLNNSFLWTNKLGNKLYWAVISYGHGQIKGGFTGMYIYNMLNKVFFAKRFSCVESFSKTFINESFSSEDKEDWGKIQMLFCSLDIKKSELQFVNLGIDVELIRNEKVWDFKPISRYITSNMTDTLISNKVNLQDGDDLIFFSHNWGKEDSVLSAGKHMYKDSVLTEPIDINSFIEDLSSQENIEDFVILSLKK